MDSYFLPRDNKVYSFIVRRSPVYRYSLTICLVGLFVFVWVQFLYIPSTSTLGRYQQELRQGQSNQRMAHTLQTELLDLEQRVGQMGSFINDNSAKQLSTDTFQSHVFFVAQQASKLGLALNSAMLDPEQDKEWYIKDAASFEVQGNFNSLLAWFDQIKNSKNMIRCNKLSMHNVDGVNFSCSCKLTFFVPKMLVKN